MKCRKMKPEQLIDKIRQFQELILDHKTLWDSSLSETFPDYPQTHVEDLRAQCRRLNRMLGAIRPNLETLRRSWTIWIPQSGVQVDALESSVAFDEVAQVKGPCLEKVIAALDQILGRLTAFETGPEESEVDDSDLPPIVVKSMKDIDPSTPAAPNELRTLKTKGRKEVPDGTIISIRKGNRPLTVEVTIQLPGQSVPKVIRDIPIANGVAELPVPLAFLCHADEDKPFVETTASRLLQDGVLTWLDKKDLLPGDDWRAVIEDALEPADFVVVFLSSASVSKRGFVQREVRYALEQMQERPLGSRYIIPILVDECDPPRELRNIQWAKCWDDGWYEKLLRVLDVR